MTQVTVYNDGSKLPNELFFSIVKAACNPNWAGHPLPQYAMAKAAIIAMEKKKVLLLGHALRHVFQQVVINGFENNSRFAMPVNDKGASGTSAGAIAATKFINEAIVDFRELLTDGYGE